MENLYYTAPRNKEFNDLKEKAIEVWKEIATNPNYAEEKIGRIKDLENIKDNFMYIFSIFDPFNQRKVMNKISEKTATEIIRRLVAGNKK